MIISIKKCLLNKFHNDAAASHLSDVNCTGMKTAVLNNISMYSMEAVPRNASCGNVMVINSTHVTYLNTLHISPLISTTGIISGRPVNSGFSCTYLLNMQTSLATILHPMLNTTVLSSDGNGTATTTIAAYSNPSYTSPIQMGGQNLPLGSTIYFGMSTEFADSDDFVLRVETCFATPTDNPENPPKVYLIQNGCPVTGDIYIKVVSNGESLEVRFSIESFTFQGSSEVYIYCDARLCDKTAAQVCTGCIPAGSRSGDITLSLGNFQLGPLYFGDDSGDSNSASQTVVSWAVLGSSLLALLSLRLI